MIQIPDPCNEDFSKMTATQRGAFCSKCQIDTFDFRDLSDKAVNTLLYKHRNEHLCGRFSLKQLHSLNKGFEDWKRQGPRTVRSKFLLALVVVFGLSLFSCNSEGEKAILQVQTLALSRAPKTKVQYVNYQHDVNGFDLTNYIAVDPDLEIGECGSEIEIDLEPVVVVERQARDVYVTADVFEDYETAGVPIDIISVRGDMDITTTYATYLQETIADTLEESLLPEPIEIDPSVFIAKAYPNPTVGPSTVELNVEQEGYFDIILTDMSGAVIDIIFTGQLPAGRQLFTADLSDAQSGLFFVRITSETQQEILKIQKVN